MLLPKSLIVKENWIFAIFLALFPLINKSILCGLRAYRGKNNGKQDFIAGGNFPNIKTKINIIVSFKLLQEASVFQFYLVHFDFF